MPPQLAPLKVEEQQLYSRYMLENKAPYPISTAQPNHLLDGLSFLARSCYYLVIIATFTLHCLVHVSQHKEEHWVRKTHLFQSSMFVICWDVLHLCGTKIKRSFPQTFPN